MESTKVLYRAIHIVIKPGTQSIITVAFDPPIEHAPTVTIMPEADNGYFELKEVKYNGVVKLPND